MSARHHEGSSHLDKRRFGVGFAASVAVLTLLGGLYFAGQRSVEYEKSAIAVQPSPSQPSRGTVKPVTGDDHIRGSVNAKVAIIEYSDLECPFCQRFHGTAQQAVDSNDGDVAWVYRHFPLSSHRNAQEKAEASECVNDLGGNDAFWTFIDGMFEVGPSFQTSQLGQLAVRAGVSESDFQECLSSGMFRARVLQDLSEGQASGVTGTPGSFIVSANGQQYVPGALPFEQIQQVIDSLL